MFAPLWVGWVGWGWSCICKSTVNLPTTTAFANTQTSSSCRSNFFTHSERQWITGGLSRTSSQACCINQSAKDEISFFFYLKGIISLWMTEVIHSILQSCDILDKMIHCERTSNVNKMKACYRNKSTFGILGKLFLWFFMPALMNTTSHYLPH